MNDLVNDIGAIVDGLREVSPLTHCITNVVTVNDCANAVLAVGGSPIMANEPCEAREIVRIVNSLLINTGTLTSSQVSAMKLAVSEASVMGKPYVLDPVGIGISGIRNDVPLKLIGIATPSIIRGNLSEIKAVANFYGVLDECVMAKGVDVAEGDVISEDTVDSNSVLVRNIADKLGTTVAVSGPIDIVSDGVSVLQVRNGHGDLSRITGSGCMLGCLMASYCNVASPLLAATCASVVMGVCGELAHDNVVKNNAGTGSFRTYLIDELSKIGSDCISEYADVRSL